MSAETTLQNTAQPGTVPASSGANAASSGAQAAARELSGQQIAVLEALLAGSSVTDAAAAAGVDRGTVHRWQRYNFDFQAALNQARKDLRKAVVHRLERLAKNATECVDKAVCGGDVKAALEIVKRLDTFSGRYLGSEDADELALDEFERQQKIAERGEQSNDRADRLREKASRRRLFAK